MFDATWKGAQMVSLRVDGTARLHRQYRRGCCDKSTFEVSVISYEQSPILLIFKDNLSATPGLSP
jgi:hypothetical protein